MDKQTDRQTDATERPTHAGGDAGMANNNNNNNNNNNHYHNYNGEW